MSTELRNQIRNYLGTDKITATNTYVKFGIDNTIQELILCFQQPLSLEELSSARYFLRDGLETKLALVPKIQEALEASELTRIMRERLLNSVASERNILVDAMRANMLGYKEVFHAAFLRFRDTDPLLMPTLIREACWTRAVEGWELHEKLLKSPCYLSRWAALQCVEGMIDFSNATLLERITCDPHPRISKEALYRWALFERDSNHHRFTKSENRQKRKEIEVTRPLIFSDLSQLFWKHQHEKNVAWPWDYTIEELSAFEQTLP
ncbi:MAG: hypothetical protein NTX57_20680 [Armatimonadetes bacterium]|nr:hypothetical protein [Armatimonadota bacterium]